MANRGRGATSLERATMVRLDPSGRDALLSVLPPVLHFQGRRGRPSGHLDTVLQILLTEAHGTSAGSALCVARLVDLMLVYAIRDWLANEPANVGGWLGAIRTWGPPWSLVPVGCGSI